ncbi:RNA-splicing factor [Blastocladiella emersonii ATCC 22665]|nr:RNA-splicing factor [Blastocladiella emersonii ATCC 22665]
MGGGDLNLKKSWHPQTFKNQERVWKEEQRAAEEARKLEQLRKELAEERQKQELMELQEKAGLIKRSNRIDWMYAVPAGAGGGLSTDAEDFLLGRKRAERALTEQAKAKAAEATAAAMGATSALDMIALSNPKANTARDLMSKVRDDPMFAIKRREQEAIQRMLSNPIQVKSLQEKHKKNKKEKKEKKEKRHKSSKRDRPAPAPRDRQSERRRSRSPPASARRTTHFDMGARRRSPAPSHHHHRPDPAAAAEAEAARERERAAKLAAMMQDAKEVERDRLARAEAAERAAAEEAAALERAGPRPDGAARFTRNLLGGSGSGASSVAESISRNKHYLDGRREGW